MKISKEITNKNLEIKSTTDELTEIHFNELFGKGKVPASKSLLITVLYILVYLQRAKNRGIV